MLTVERYFSLFSLLQIQGFTFLQSSFDFRIDFKLRLNFLWNSIKNEIKQSSSLIRLDFDWSALSFSLWVRVVFAQALQFNWNYFMKPQQRMWSRKNIKHIYHSPLKAKELELNKASCDRRRDLFFYGEKQLEMFDSVSSFIAKQWF